MQDDFFKPSRTQLGEEAEKQIKEKHKETDYDIREYPVEIIVSKFLEKLDNDRAELFVPDYQREMVWSETRQSRFIESADADSECNTLTGWLMGFHGTWSSARSSLLSDI